MNKILYQHDCGKCIYLGSIDGVDLYFHPASDCTQTVVARYSDNPCDYSSGLGFSRPYVDIAGNSHYGIPELVEARLRAERLGLLNT